MINWLILIIVGIVIFVVMELNHITHKALPIVLIVVVLFLFVSFSIISKNNNVDISSPKGIVQGIGIYYTWLTGGLPNIRSITGEVINQSNETTSKVIDKAKDYMIG